MLNIHPSQPPRCLTGSISHYVNINWVLSWGLLHFWLEPDRSQCRNHDAIIWWV
jgi:hypothetical protein